MNKKLKLMIILGTRPEIIRLSEIIKLARKCFDTILVHTGQNYDYELNEIFFKELGLDKPDVYLSCAGDNLGESMGNIISKTYDIIEKNKPDAILILGDTNSALSAISAKRLKTPIFHMEAGNRCWDDNVAEMTNRRIVDHISDVNLPYTNNSKLYLLQEGLDGKYIFVTGSPLFEVISKHAQDIANNCILDDLGLTKQQYILASIHREENVTNIQHLQSILASLNEVCEVYHLPIILSCHPRTKKMLEENQLELNPLIKIMKPFGFLEYVKLQTNAKIVLSDSGTITEESAILGFPAVLIRTSTERPEGLDMGSIVIGGIDSHNVLNAIELSLSLANNQNKLILTKEYTDYSVSQKVIKIIQSMTDAINRSIWNKGQ